MSIALAGLTHNYCLVYLEDLKVFRQTLEQHNKNLIGVFDWLKNVNLKINPGKCAFLRKKLLC